MWKYKCKTQFLILVAAFCVGVLLMAFTFSNSAITSAGIVPPEVLSFMKSNIVLTYAMGGLVVAGIVNAVLISQMLIPISAWAPYLIFMLLFMMPDTMLMISTFLVIPMMIVTLYGWLSLRSSTLSSLRARKISNDEEIVRIYQIHHQLLPEYKELAIKCRKQIDRISLIYALGIVAIFCIMFFINNIWILVLALLFYMMAFNALLRYRAQCFIPITKLLYENCDPQACFSAIVYYSTKRNKIKLTQKSLLAQCLIYMDDPELAQDILITYPRKDAASTLTYWSLMGYIDYMLKDEAALIRCKEEASKVRMNFGPTGVMIRSEEIASIENKIRLMNGDFNECKKYYLASLKHSPFPFQQVDASYYIALISFVQEDYNIAKMYFEKVVELGNTMYFVKKAESYLTKINNLNLDAE